MLREVGFEGISVEIVAKEKEGPGFQTLLAVGTKSTKRGGRSLGKGGGVGQDFVRDAPVAKLADALDSGSSGETLGGSNPLGRTN